MCLDVGHGCDRKALGHCILKRGARREACYDDEQHPGKDRRIEPVLVNFRSVRWQEIQKLCQQRGQQNCRQEEKSYVGQAGIDGEHRQAKLPQLPAVAAEQGAD